MTEDRRLRPIDAVRLVVAVAILAAVLGQLLLSISIWRERGDVSLPINVWNFFSFFTILSNLSAIAVLAAQVVQRLRGTMPSPRMDVLVLCSTCYMTVTGVVYNLMLRGIELPQGTTLAWSNEVLHLFGPLWLLIDWILVSASRKVRFSDLWKVIVFPVVWLVYTLVRALFIPNDVTGAAHWYPYPFLNPDNFDSGYGGVALMCVVIAAVVVGAAALLILLARRRSRKTPA